MAENALSPEVIKRGLKTRFIGQNIVYHASLASTMDAARQAALEGVPEGTVILAEQQTAGRGRLARAWLSDEGCLTFSIVLYPDTRYLTYLVMVSCLAVADTVEWAASLKPEIKWPNDVLVRGRKISGILIETAIQERQPSHAVIGIGLNVNFEPSECPDIGETATSLSAETGRQFSRVAVLRELFARFEGWYDDLLSGESVFEAWRGRLVTLGKMVRVRTGKARYEGTAEDVAPDGALLLRQSDGGLLKMPAGDVILKSD